VGLALPRAARLWRPGGRLLFLPLLALEVVVQGALAQRRHVDDDLAQVRGLEANEYPLAG
jgi:hypothetical protein